MAAVSDEAARAGARVADRGGGAMDAAVAAALVSVVTHPGMCSLGGGAFATLLPVSAPPCTVDGGVAFPGRGAPDPPAPEAAVEARLQYAGGVVTTVGPASVGVPGLLAALDRVAREHGLLPWKTLVEPARERVKGGFPLPPACHRFLRHAHDVIYGRDPRGRAALHDPDGELLEAGETVRVPGLASSLEAIAREGTETFYRGEMGGRIVDHVRAGGGTLTREDLAAYRAVPRRPLETSLDGWRVATNPLPAVGGVALSALLRLGRSLPGTGCTAGDVAALARHQLAVEAVRRRELAPAPDPRDAAARLLSRADNGDPEALTGPDDAAASGGGSGSTLHVSAVDSDGRACAITCSDGYGSGVMPPGTGIWLNNCLGERELVPDGPGSRPPGTRLPSNMAPTVAFRDGGTALAVGSPGGPRIPAIVAQVLRRRVRGGRSLCEAVGAPRVLAEPGDDGAIVSVEPGIPTGALSGDVRVHPERSMFFGGVAAAEGGGAVGLGAAADPRRGGGTAEGGSA